MRETRERIDRIALSFSTDVEFTSLNGKPYQLYAVCQPQLNNPVIAAPLNESGVTQGNALLASDAQMQVASALAASPAFTETSNGYLGTSDGGTDLSQHFQLTAHYSRAERNRGADRTVTPDRALGQSASHARARLCRRRVRRTRYGQHLAGGRVRSSL